MLNDALFYESYEIIGGKKMAAAAANPFHGSINLNLNFIDKYKII